VTGDWDVVLAMPYPYADHPSFPEAILKRSLETAGFTVGVIACPRWQNPADFATLGRPRLFFAVVPGPVDSTVLNFTSLRKRRREDLYQTGGNAFFTDAPAGISAKIRPDRTVMVFANRLRQAFPRVPLLIGGLEASQRMFAHYDFQEDGLRRGILFDSRADLLVFGPGEKQVVEIARRVKAGQALGEIVLPGTARIVKAPPPEGEYPRLPPGEEVMADPPRLLEAQLILEQAILAGKGAVQRQVDRYLVREPGMPYEAADLDRLYALPFTRTHPGLPVLSPALQMNLFSVTAHRGCGGGCTFCAITAMEGRRIVSRSPDSILREIRSLADHPRWRGVVSDIGGPSADLYGEDCPNPGCPKPSCLVPRCPRPQTPGRAYLELLGAARNLPGVERVLIGSGLRHDRLAENPELLEEVLRHHAGGFLRIAPEHTEEPVLARMRKPGFGVLAEVAGQVAVVNRRLPRPVQLALYLIVGHPGESREMVTEMGRKLRTLGPHRRDVQVFTPTPGTLATAMYVAGLDEQGRAIPVERGAAELARRQRSLADPR